MSERSEPRAVGTHAPPNRTAAKVRGAGVRRQLMAVIVRSRLGLSGGVLA